MTIYELMGERSLDDLITQLADGHGAGFCPAYELRKPCGQLESCAECWALALSKVEEVKLKCAK